MQKILKYFYWLNNAIFYTEGVIYIWQQTQKCDSPDQDKPNFLVESQSHN